MNTLDNNLKIWNYFQGSNSVQKANTKIMTILLH